MSVKDKVIQKLKIKEINIYSNYTAVFGAIKNQPLYLQMTKELGYLGLPLCYKEGRKYYAISGIEDIEAAKSIGLTEIEVEVRDIPEKDRLKYLSVTTLFKNKEYKAISIFIDKIEEYFTTPDGEDWCKILPKDRKKRLSYVTGLSESTIQRYHSVGAEYRHFLTDVQNGDKTWKEVIEFINELKNLTDDVNEFDIIEKERAEEQALKAAEKDRKAKEAAKQADKKRKEEETAAIDQKENNSSNQPAPSVFANRNKNPTPVLDANSSYNQNHTNDNSQDEQFNIEKSTHPRLHSANILMENGMEVTVTKDMLRIDGNDIQVSVAHQVFERVYSSTFTTVQEPEIKIRITIENYDALTSIMNI